MAFLRRIWFNRSVSGNCSWNCGGGVCPGGYEDMAIGLDMSRRAYSAMTRFFSRHKRVPIVGLINRGIAEQVIRGSECFFRIRQAERHSRRHYN
jgi:hypothetical protein